jgi:hypothetical protein
MGSSSQAGLRSLLSHHPQLLTMRLPQLQEHMHWSTRTQFSSLHQHKQGCTATHLMTGA